MYEIWGKNKISLEFYKGDFSTKYDVLKELEKTIDYDKKPYQIYCSVLKEFSNLCVNYSIKIIRTSKIHSGKKNIYFSAKTYKAAIQEALKQLDFLDEKDVVGIEFDRDIDIIRFNARSIISIMILNDNEEQDWISVKELKEKLNELLFRYFIYLEEKSNEN